MNGNGIATGLTTSTANHLSVNGNEPPPVVLSVPTKKSKSIRFGPALLPYIANAYAEDATLYEHDCQALDDLRADAIQLPDVLAISTIDRLFMYYSQLVFLGTRFPLDVNQLHILWNVPHTNVASWWLFMLGWLGVSLVSCLSAKQKNR